MFQRNKITSSLLKEKNFKPGSRGFIIFFLKKIPQYQNTHNFPWVTDTPLDGKEVFRKKIRFTK